MKIYVIKPCGRSFNLILTVILMIVLSNYTLGQNEQYTIIGKVIDENGLPLANTSIFIEPVKLDRVITESGV